MEDLLGSLFAIIFAIVCMMNPFELGLCGLFLAWLVFKD